MPNSDFGMGPGVKAVGADSTSGKRGRMTTSGTQEQGSFGAMGGVRGAGGGQGSVAYPQGAQSRRIESQGTGNGRDGSPGESGGVKSVPAASSGRGSPGAAPAPASARRLTPVGGAPSSQNSRVSSSVQETGSTSPQEVANRAGFMGSRPDGRPRGAETFDA